jgi:hypothetical protein
VDVCVENGEDEVGCDAWSVGGGIELVEEAGREGIYGVGENRPQGGDEAGRAKPGGGQVEGEEGLEGGWGVVVDERWLGILTMVIMSVVL